MGIPITDMPSNYMFYRTPKMCAACGATLSSEEQLNAHQVFHEYYIHKSEVKQMSSAAWCDPGNHAFKAGVPGSQSFTGTSVNDEGMRVTEQVDVCPEHAFQHAPNPKMITE